MFKSLLKSPTNSLTFSMSTVHVLLAVTVGKTVTAILKIETQLVKTASKSNSSCTTRNYESYIKS